MKFYDFYTITAPFDIFLASLLAWAFTLKDVFIYFMFGYIFNFLINYALKGIFMLMFREHCFVYRPETNFPKSGCGFYPQSSKNNLCCKEANFPSTFGQIIGYFVSFIFAYVVYQETKDNPKKQKQIHAVGLANLINIFDPEIIVLGGGGARLPEQELMEKFILSPLAKKTKVVFPKMERS